jgi:hypothetical protein
MFNSASGMEVVLNATFPTTVGATTQLGDQVLCNGQPPVGYNAGFILTGDGQNNTPYVINGTAQTCVAVHYIANDNTFSFVTDLDGYGQLLIDRPGVGTGVFAIEENSSASIVLTISDHQYLARSMTLQVTQFGAVGADVFGLFSGTAYRVDPVTFEEIEITISNGYFRCLRAPDEP